MARFVGCLPGTISLRNPDLIFPPYAPGAPTASGETKFEKLGPHYHRSVKISANQLRGIFAKRSERSDATMRMCEEAIGRALVPTEALRGK